METIDYIGMAGNKAKGGRPYFFQDPAVERVLNIAMALAGELAVARERLDTLERILEQKGILSRDEIEAFVPDDAAAEQRQTWHAEYIARVLRIVQQEMEALTQPENNVPLEQIADQLAEM
jgi:polyhydroxyalkanoate synthesis regulator phasin